MQQQQTLAREDIPLISRVAKIYLGYYLASAIIKQGEHHCMDVKAFFCNC